MCGFQTQLVKSLYSYWIHSRKGSVVAIILTGTPGYPARQRHTRTQCYPNCCVGDGRPLTLLLLLIIIMCGRPLTLIFYNCLFA